MDVLKLGLLNRELCLSSLWRCMLGTGEETALGTDSGVGGNQDKVTSCRQGMGLVVLRA